MSELQTNIVVEHHSAWTLTEHLLQSVNKAVAKTDAKIYGTTTNIVVTPVPFSERHPVLTGAGEIIGGIALVIVLFVIFLGYCSGQIRGRDIIGI